MEGEPHEMQSEVLRTEHVGSATELQSTIRSLLKDAAVLMERDGLYDIVVRDPEGHEFSKTVLIEHARQVEEAEWSPGESMADELLANLYARQFHEAGVPGGNPHPIDVTVELRRATVER